MNPLVLEAPIRYGKCPSCLFVDAIPPDTTTHFHNCPALGDISIPLVEITDPDDKVKARQLVVEGAVRTERMDGSNDVTVFPNPAVAICTT